MLGVDRNGYSYIHFPLFCGADLRVYRQKFEEMSYSEPESPPVKVCIPDSYLVVVVVVVVVVMTSPSGTAYMGGQQCPEEMRKSTRLRIRRDLSLPHDS